VNAEEEPTKEKKSNFAASLSNFAIQCVRYRTKSTLAHRRNPNLYFSGKTGIARQD
jgi:hypothetical protein